MSSGVLSWFSRRRDSEIDELMDRFDKLAKDMRRRDIDTLKFRLEEITNKGLKAIEEGEVHEQ